MKRRLACLGSQLLVLMLLGCNGTRSTPAGGEFPEYLVGVWEARTPKVVWGLQFAPDGSITKMIHPIAGQVKMSEGGSYVQGRDEGTFALAIMGPIQTHYDAKTRILKVDIKVDRFHMKLPQGDLEGNTEDHFEGPVSEDGKTWTAKLRSYTVLEGAQQPDRAAIDANPKTLVFKKLDLPAPAPVE